MEVRVKIAVNPDLQAIVRYAWNLFEKHIGFSSTFTENTCDLLVATTPDADVRISEIFLRNIAERKYRFENYFGKEPLIRCADGIPDYLGTAFYMINCLQEYDHPSADDLGRFRYVDSYQHRYDCVEKDLVADCFSQLYASLPVLQGKVERQTKPARIFLSHDNDTFYGSFLQDGMYALKKGRFDIVLRLMANEIARKPGWLNLDRIMDIEDAYDVKSTFFWLVNKDPKNADYDIHSQAIRNLIGRIKGRGFEQGLHKSVAPNTFNEELKKLDFPVKANRNHFLRIALPDHFEAIGQENIPLDFSLGFAEKMGFRNSYGLPFRPFDMQCGKPYGLLEVPLNIMDTTFFNYEKMPVTQTETKILSFLDKYRTGSIISVLWHNNFFTPYKFKGYLQLYKSILDYMRTNSLQSISQQELIREFYR